MSRSLGTLTLDLVARTAGFVQGMTKAERESNKFRRNVRRNMQQAGRAVRLVVGAAAAAGGALAALVVSAARTADEFAKMSLRTGVSVESLSQLEFAAKQSGTSLQDVELSLQRLARVANDARQGLAAPQRAFDAIGISATDASGELRGTEELLLDIASKFSEMEDGAHKAALAQELFGRSGARLIPLLNEGADGIEKLKAQADALGLTFSTHAAEAAVRFNDNLNILRSTATGFRNQLAQRLLPTMDALVQELVDGRDGANDFEGALDGVESVIRGTAAGAIVAGSAISNLVRAMAALAAAGAEIDVRRSDALLGGIPRIIIRNREIIQQQIEILGDVFSDLEGNFKNSLDRARRILNNAFEELEREVKDGAGRVSEAADPEDAAGSVAATTNALRDMAADLRRQVDTFDLSAAAVLRYRIEQGDLAEQVRETGEEGRRLAEQIVALSDELESMQDQARKTEEFERLIQDLRTEEERLSDQLRERIAILDEATEATEEHYRRAIAAASQAMPEFGGISPEVGGAFGELIRIDEAQAELDDWLQLQLDMLARHREERADLEEHWNAEEQRLRRAHQDEMARIDQARMMTSLAATESIFGNMADATKAFVGEQSSLYKTLFAIQKAAAIAQSLVAIQQGIAMAAANPWPLNLAAMASVAAATAGLVANIQSVALAGVAHDGLDRVPRTGTFLLEEGERVVTAETSAKLDSTLDRIERGNRGGDVVVNLHEDRERGGEVERSEREDGTMEVNIFVADIMADGPRARAMQQAFGLQRQGR